MPPAPAGFVACRVHDGDQKLLALGARRQVTHLVRLDEKGSNGGRPTVCGLSRFPSTEWVDGEQRTRPPDLPGWGMGGSGVYGPGIVQERCEACFERALPPGRTKEAP